MQLAFKTTVQLWLTGYCANLIEWKSITVTLKHSTLFTLQCEDKQVDKRSKLLIKHEAAWWNHRAVPEETPKQTGLGAGTSVTPPTSHPPPGSHECCLWWDCRLSNKLFAEVGTQWQWPLTFAHTVCGAERVKNSFVFSRCRCSDKMFHSAGKNYLPNIDFVVFLFCLLFQRIKRIILYCTSTE